MRTIPLVAGLALLGILIEPFHAVPPLADPGAARPRLGAWVEGAKVQKLTRPWEACPRLAELLAPGEGEEVRARTAGRDVDLERYSAGSGRWATASTTTVRLARGSCRAVGFSEVGGKESLLSAIWLRGFEAAPSLADAAALAGAVEVADSSAAPGTPELAAARILIELTRDPTTPSVGPDQPGGLFAPAWPVQAVHRGKPRSSPATLWSPAALEAAGVVADLVAEEGAPAAAILAHAVRAPRPLLTRGRWQLWELRFRARLGGGLLAVYDSQRDEHRWLWATEHDTSTTTAASHFDVLVFRDGIALVHRRLDDDDELWAIDVARGVTRQLARRGPFRWIEGGGLEVETEDDGRQVVPWESLRP